MKPIPHAVLALCLATSLPALAQQAERAFIGFRNDNGTLEIATSDGRYLIRPYDANIVETSFVPRGETFDPASHAVVLKPGQAQATVREADGRIQLVTDGITVTIDKTPFRISYAYKGRPLVAEKGGYGDVVAGIQIVRTGNDARSSGAGALRAGTGFATLPILHSGFAHCTMKTQLFLDLQESGSAPPPPKHPTDRKSVV